VPLAIALTGAHVHDYKVFGGLIDSIVPVRGKRGGPRRRPEKLHADKGYDYPRCRRFLRKRGHQGEDSQAGRRERREVSPPPVGGRADAGTALPLQASLRTLRAANGHPRGLPGPVLRTRLPQLSPTGALKRPLRAPDYRATQQPEIFRGAATFENASSSRHLGENIGTRGEPRLPALPTDVAFSYP
jgi:hypothetical protein